ncbi:MAG: DUF4855 domain-containing protein [Clostridia bacterium]|nr:DUF4855 domain-containing protein [Clostridia bacterium]
MKKTNFFGFVSLLLLAAMILLTSCEGGETASTPEASETVSTEDAPSFVLSEKVEEIKGYMTKDIDRSLKAKNVFKGLTYTPSRESDGYYTDSANQKLTDGYYLNLAYGPHYYAGWSGGGSLTITFDLGEAEHAIGDIYIGCYKNISAGANLPGNVSVKVSDNGKDYTKIGRIDTPSDTEYCGKFTYNFAFPKAVTARYIKITFSSQNGNMLFVDEITAFEYCEDGDVYNTLGDWTDPSYPVTDFYGYNLNLGESEVKVSKEDKDYDTLQNLAKLKGVDFQIQHFEPIIKNHSNTGMDKISMITDGKLHGNIEGDYFIFYRGAGRHVVADLGTVMAVQGCTVTFQDKPSWGIATPPVYYISVSENGTDWVTVFAEHNPEYGIAEKGNDTRKIEFEEQFLARYVRITFPTVPDNEISSSVYMGEFEIWGKKNTASAVKAFEPEGLLYGTYPDPEDVGMNDILFTCITDGYGKVCEDVHVLTLENAYKYLAHRDEKGNAAGVLFDSLAFTTRGELNSHPDRNESTEWFLSELFREGVNMDAADSAKGMLNEALGTDDKEMIWISVNCPAIGDIFNGKEIETAEDYIECLKWQADEAIRRFNEKGYENLLLTGFYWQVENIRPNAHAPAEAYDKEAVIAFNEYLHSMGYKSLWCPYYSRINGIWHSKYYGFDITCWQPNLMFDQIDPYRLSTISELAKIYGVGIEIETDTFEQSKQTLNMYREYLNAGFEYGFINSVNAYYQGAIPGAYISFENSDRPHMPTIFYESVKYITGTMDGKFGVTGKKDISEFKDTVLTVKNGKSASVFLGDLSEIEYRYELTPLFGSVRLDKNGTLTYTAMKGYAGEDQVKISVFDGENTVKIITVNITVTE